MIDTKRTKDGAQQDYDNGNLTPEWKHEIDELCDSHDELERKLQSAHSIIEYFEIMIDEDQIDIECRNDEDCDHCYLMQSLDYYRKQIRGSND